MSIVGNTLGDRTPAPGGDFSSMLALLADQQKLQERLASLQEAQAAAMQAIALVAPAEEIPKLHAAAKSDRDEAAQTLEGARADAAALMERTKADAAALVESATAEAAGIRSGAESELMAARAEVASMRDTARAELVQARAEAADLRARAKAKLDEVVLKGHALDQDREAFGATQAAALQELEEGRAAVAALRDQADADMKLASETKARADSLIARLMAVMAEG
jgi:hypothetical protein